MAVFALTITHGDRDIKRKVIGKWKVYDAEIIKPENIDPKLKAETIEIVKSYEYHFKSNGVLNYSDFLIKDAVGKWNLRDSVLKFEYNFADPFYSNVDEGDKKQRHTFEAHIYSVSKQEMKWRVDIEDDQFIYYLKKE